MKDTSKLSTAKHAQLLQRYKLESSFLNYYQRGAEANDNTELP